MRVASALLLTAVLLLLCASPRVAHADDPDPRVVEEAAARYDRGVKLYDAGDYPGALAEFEAAYKLTGAWQVLYNVALCQKKLFRYGQSVRTFEKYLADGGADVPAERRQAVQKELAEIKALVAEITVVVDGAPARIEVDGQYEGETPLDRPLLLGSGRHVIRASREGQLADEKVIDVVSGQNAEVRLEPRDKPKQVTTAKVTIDTVPPGAALTIDGKPVGPAPWTGELPAGGHAVSAESDGFSKTSKEVVVTAGQQRTVTIELIPLVPPPPPPKPVYKKAWFWGAVGAGVAAAAVGGYFLFSEEPTYDVVIVYDP